MNISIINCIALVNIGSNLSCCAVKSISISAFGECKVKNVDNSIKVYISGYNIL